MVLIEKLPEPVPVGVELQLRSNGVLGILFEGDVWRRKRSGWRNNCDVEDKVRAALAQKTGSGSLGTGPKRQGF